MAQHEIGQFDIPDRQLLVVKKGSKGGSWTDIGKAKITHTIFGRAKVRVIREKDKIRRARLMTAMALVVLAGSVWLGWNAARNSELLQSETAMPPVSIKPSEPLLTEEGKLESDLVSTPFQPLDLRASDRIGDQAGIIQSLTEIKLRTELSAKGKNTSQHESGLKSTPKPQTPNQSSAPVIAILPASGSVASKPAIPAASGGPLIEKEATSSLPDELVLPTDPVDIQP